MEALIVPDHTEAHPGQKPAEGADRIEHELAQILVSSHFCHSQQSQRLLRYIVERSLAHEDHLLRERVIGSVVFGRPPDYDTGDDPIVRIRAADLRKRLAQYYQSFTDQASLPEFNVEIPIGSYRAVFRWHDAGNSAHAPEPARLSAIEPVKQLPDVICEPHTHLEAWTAPLDVSAPLLTKEGTRSKARRIFTWSVVSAVILLATVAGFWFWTTSTESDFRAFWRPWVGSSKPVIIAIGSNAVYRLSDDLTERYAREHGLEPYGVEFFVPLDAISPLRGNDLTPAYDSFVALGDVAAVSSIVGNLASHKQTFQERFPNDVSFAELRNNATVLVGGFNNPMTIALTKSLPFVFRARNEIDDTTNGRKWILHASPDSHDTEDYAIVTRMTNRNGDAPVLSVAGMGQYGTIAAANFVTNPAIISQLARGLEHDQPHWADRNLQVVLHVKVVDFKPISVEIVAKKIW
jgi:hypothetical protein